MMRVVVMMCMLGTAVAQTYSWDAPGEKPDDRTDNACTLDTGSCSCCVMVRELHSLSMRFNDTIDQLESNLTKVQAAVNHLRKSQISFSTALTDMRRCVGPYRSDTIVMYKVLLTNLGSAYDDSTGVFTAPCSGVYFFSVTAFSDAGSPGAGLSVCVKLLRNGTPQVSLTEQNKEDQEDSVSASLLLSLRAGDEVSVQLPAGCFLCDDENHYNTFTGYLVYATD